MRTKVMNLPGSSNAFWFFVRFLVRRIGVSSCFGIMCGRVPGRVRLRVLARKNAVYRCVYR